MADPVSPMIDLTDPRLVRLENRLSVFDAAALRNALAPGGLLDEGRAVFRAPYGNTYALAWVLRHLKGAAHEHQWLSVLEEAVSPCLQRHGKPNTARLFAPDTPAGREARLALLRLGAKALDWGDRNGLGFDRDHIEESSWIMRSVPFNQTPSVAGVMERWRDQVTAFERHDLWCHALVLPNPWVLRTLLAWGHDVQDMPTPGTLQGTAGHALIRHWRSYGASETLQACMEVLDTHGYDWSRPSCEDGPSPWDTMAQTRNPSSTGTMLGTMLGAFQEWRRQWRQDGWEERWPAGADKTPRPRL